jgi:hypothetical protein
MQQRKICINVLVGWQGRFSSKEAPPQPATQLGTSGTKFIWISLLNAPLPHILAAVEPSSTSAHQRQM